MVCVVPVGQKAAVMSWLANNGLDVNRDQNGIALTKDEDIIGEVCTPILKDVVTLDKYFMMRVTDEFAATLPDKPNYILWRSDGLYGPVENTVQATVDDYDATGSVIGTRMQGVGRIA